MIKNYFDLNKIGIGAAREYYRNVLNINLSIKGNKKLINNNETHFIIFNIPAVRTCPDATPECIKNCYARIAEALWSDCKAARYNNLKSCLQDNFTFRLMTAINIEVSWNEKKGIKSIVRLHESGDFFNQMYFDSWLEVCNAFLGRNAVFMAYTKSIRFLIDRTIPENLFVRFSIWSDTKPEQIELAKKLNLPIYTAAAEDIVNRLIATGKYVLCECKDCAKCGKCWNPEYKNIICIIHGNAEKLNKPKKAKKTAKKAA